MRFLIQQKYKMESLRFLIQQKNYKMEEFFFRRLLGRPLSCYCRAAIFKHVLQSELIIIDQ